MPKNVTDRERKTFVLDSVRMATDGVVISLQQTVVLVVAISAFLASDALKTVLSSAPHLGQLATLFFTAALARRSIRPTRIAGVLGAGSAMLFLVAAFSTRATAYTIWIALAMMLFNVRFPFIAAVHGRNYPAERRGRRFSTGLILLLAVALGFDLLAGNLLEQEIGHYRYLLIGASVAILAGSVALWLIPSRPAPVSDSRNPFRNLAVLKSDRLFRKMIIAWFVMGFANLFTVPLRVVYLAEAERGLGLSPLSVIIIAGVIPQVIRLIFSRVWASLFDRVHLVIVRITLALLLGTGIFLFFSTRLIPVIIAGQVLLNIAFAGGPILWNLWVTRIAPAGQTSVYMSVHSFMTGVRGSLGPALGFLAIAGLSFRIVGTISLALVIVSVILMLPLVRHPRAAPPG